MYRKLKTTFVLAFLIMLYISPIVFNTSSTHTAILTEPNMSKDFQTSSDWYSSSWHYRKSITITGSVGAGVGYQVHLNITWNANIQSDYDDLRFTDDDSITLLDYWIVSYNSVFALVWVKVNDDLGSNQIIYMYYGNSGASAVSNGLNTFLFFDDFNDASLNASKWHIFTGAGTPAEAGGIFSLTVASGWSSYGSYERFGNGVAVGMLTKVSAETSYWVLGLDERTYNGTASGGVDWCGVVNNGGTKYYSSSDGTAENSARNRLYTSYTTLEIQRLSTKVKFYEGGIHQVSISTHLPFDATGVSILNQNAHTQYWDYVYVRNCIDTEPTAGSLGNEENNLNVQSWFSGSWERNTEPVLTETDGTNEAQVIYDVDPRILTNETHVLKMWYRVGWSTVSIYYAESTDGITWVKYGANPVLDETGDHYCPFVLKHDGVYYLFASYGPWNGDTLYNSSDGISWSIMNGGVPVIAKSSGAEWDNYAIGNVAVWVNNTGIWNMIYESYRAGDWWKLGFATSINGTTWTKYPNPVLSMSGSCGGPSVLHIGTTYFMFFHAAVSGSLPTEIYMTSSSDLIHWTTPEHILERVYAWEGVNLSTGQLADPDIVMIGNEIIMYYTGVNAQSLGHQYIGYARFIPLSETYQELLVPWTVLLGLFMIPASTLYLVKGGKDGMSANKFFYFVVAFMLGWGLLLGGIMS